MLDSSQVEGSNERLCKIGQLGMSLADDSLYNEREGNQVIEDEGELVGELCGEVDWRSEGWSWREVAGGRRHTGGGGGERVREGWNVPICSI
jgi:hypothetical protein